MKKRNLYLNQLINFKDKPFIKVITGIRRCGKSSLLTLFEEHLFSEGVKADHIIRINFEAIEFDTIRTYKNLHTFVKSKMTSNKEKHYLLLDEIQQVVSWEKAVNSFLVDSNVDIYLTGSNAYLLSSELSTLLSGRYVEIKMQPLSFKEYLDFIESYSPNNLNALFEDYLEYGGLPTVIELKDHPDTIGPFLTCLLYTSDAADE